MEFHEKLQTLRAKRGLTHEEVAAALYVSRTAVSKWESGRGYPNVDSLRAIAKFYNVTLDELLSSDELLSLAEADGASRKMHFGDLIFGLLDTCALLLLFLPFFTTKSGEAIALFALRDVQLYLKFLFLVAVLALGALGILTLALQNAQAAFWTKHKRILSLALGALASLFIILTRQPYAAAFAFALLSAKAFALFKTR